MNEVDKVQRYDVTWDTLEPTPYGAVVYADDYDALDVKYIDAKRRLAEYSMSAGHADQCRAEARAARESLGFSADSEHVSPADLRKAVAELKHTASQADALHAAICQAVAIMNQLPLDREVLQAHNILRIALTEYAFATEAKK